MTNTYFFLASAVISALVTWLCTRFALRRDLLDHPNERSSHSHPVPRVGGVGIAAGFLLPFLAACVMPGTVHLSLRATCLAVMLGMGGMAAIGLLDDFRNLAPLAKYLPQFVVAVTLMAMGLVGKEITLPYFGTIALGWLGFPLSLLWLTGFPNFFNFIDGTNGMGGGTGAIYGGFFAAFAYVENRPDLMVAGLLLAGGSLGFLVHNFPEARTFMGDTGSMFLGIGSAMMVLMLGKAGGSALVALLMVCSVSIYDCVTTIIRRLLRGENIFQAHRRHHYQRLVVAGWSHTAVALLYFGLHAAAGGLGLMYLQFPAYRWQSMSAMLALFAGLSTLAMWVERQQVDEEKPVLARAAAAK